MPGVNLAEVGQAGMRCQQNHKLLALVDVAYKDIYVQMQQDELYRATIENCTTQKKVGPHCHSARLECSHSVLWHMLAA